MLVWAEGGWSRTWNYCSELFSEGKQSEISEKPGWIFRRKKQSEEYGNKTLCPEISGKTAMNSEEKNCSTISMYRIFHISGLKPAVWAKYVYNLNEMTKN